MAAATVAFHQGTGLREGGPVDRGTAALAAWVIMLVIWLIISSIQPEGEDGNTTWDVYSGQLARRNTQRGTLARGRREGSERINGKWSLSQRSSYADQ